MSKICPNCQKIFDDNHGFCSSCGSRLIDNVESNSTLNLGDANAISGGVNINQSKNITSHDTHYHSTTVQERSKNDSELKLDAANQLRAKAEEIMAERGRIDSLAMSQLRPLATRLGIDDETFKTIIKDVRSNRNGCASGLSAANARYLQQAQQAILTNDMDGLSNLTHRLEAMAAISQDDNVQYLYYLTLSILYPIKSMEVYENQTDENYWRTFWAVISYIRTGKYAEATSVLALFDPLRYEKSEEDQNLLEAYFNIMKEDKDGTQEFLDEILGEPTEQIKPLLRAVESTLYEEEIESLEVRFYKERVMTKSDVVVKSQKNAEPSKPYDESLKQFNEEDGVKMIEECFEKGDNETAYAILKKMSDTKNAKALIKLGNHFGVAKANLLAARACFTKAMDLGDYDGALEMGNVLTLASNYSEAADWFKKAIEKGNVEAMRRLGDLYSQGWGVKQDFSEAEKLYRKAASHGDGCAKAELALLLFDEFDNVDEAAILAQEARDLNYEDLDEYLLERITEIIEAANTTEEISHETEQHKTVVEEKSQPEVIFENAGVEQVSDSSICIHVRFSVKNCMNRYLRVAIVSDSLSKNCTNTGSDEFHNREDRVFIKYEDALFEDYKFLIHENELNDWLKFNEFIKVRTHVVVHVDDELIGVCHIDYIVNHEARIFKDNKLLINRFIGWSL